MKLPVPRDIHDRVVRFIAASRFPFAGQTDWPPDSLTITNESQRRQAVAGPLWPDIVIVSQSGDIRETAEVETDLQPDWAERWQATSLAADNHTRTGVQHFFVYVPDGLAQTAQATLAENRISCAGLRSYRVSDDGTIEITPITTDGDAKDHVTTAGKAEP